MHVVHLGMDNTKELPHIELPIDRERLNKALKEHNYKTEAEKEAFTNGWIYAIHPFVNIKE